MALATTGGDLAELVSADDVLDHVLATRAGQADPYPAYARLRALAPVHRSGLDGNWYASSYDTCKQVLGDPRFGKGNGILAMRHGMDEERVKSSMRRRRPSMITSDPPEHTRLRGAAKGAFIPPRMQALRPLVASLVDERLSALAEGGDLMADVAFPLPVTVISALVGVPAEDRDLFHPLLEQIVSVDQPNPPPGAARQAEESFDAFQTYFGALIKQRRQQPGDDLLSTLIAAFEAGDLDGEELYATVSLVFIAGFLTTTNLLGNGLVALLSNPEQRDRLWADPDGRTEAAVEEMLRFDTPVQMVHRVAREDLELGGQKITAGDTVFALLGAAGRDPVRFPEPDAFRIDRGDNLHLSFAWGLHFCLGARLARLEAQLVFAGLVRRFSSVELAGEPRRRPGLFIRGLETLPLTLTPRVTPFRPAATG